MNGTGNFKILKETHKLLRSSSLCAVHSHGMQVVATRRYYMHSKKGSKSLDFLGHTRFPCECINPYGFIRLGISFRFKNSFDSCFWWNRIRLDGANKEVRSSVVLDRSQVARALLLQFNRRNPYLRNAYFLSTCTFQIYRSSFPKQLVGKENIHISMWLLSSFPTTLKVKLYGKKLPHGIHYACTPNGIYVVIFVIDFVTVLLLGWFSFPWH